MGDIGVFPTLPGLAWSVTKAPTFQTRIQRAVSGRELRALDYPYPLWQFTLTFDFLRDNPSAGFTELRRMLGFYMLAQGAFGTFLFNDPTDNNVVGQTLPAAVSSSIGATLASAGSGYVNGDLVTLAGGTIASPGGQPMQLLVGGVSGGGITGISVANGGSYTIVPGVTGLSLTGGSGSGATVNVAWATATQLVRTFGDGSLPSGGFLEPIVGQPNVSAVYFNGVSQNLSVAGWGVNPSTGVLSMPNPFYTNRVQTYSIAAPGQHYIMGDIVSASGGTGTETAQWKVLGTGVRGAIESLAPLAIGSYTSLPSAPVPLTGGSGTGGTLNVTWSPLVGITADFVYYFRCRFVDDSYDFENFMSRLWQLKKLTFISVRP